MDDAEFERLFAAVRPGAHKEDLAPLLAAMETQSDGVFYNLKGRCSLWFDAGDAVKSVTFGRDFSVDLDLHSLRVGMTVDEVQGLYPELKVYDTYTKLEGPPIIYLDGPVLAGDIALKLSVRDGLVLGVTLQTRTESAADRAAREEAERRGAALEAQRKRANAWRDVADPDTMLDVWAAGAWRPDWVAIWTRYVRWLKAASPIERHQSACSWNWDHDMAPLLWLIRQPETDLATVTQLFFDAEPSYYVETGWDRAKAGSNGDAFDLILEIIDRVRSGFYAHSAISLEGRRRYTEQFSRAEVRELTIFDRDLSGAQVARGAFGDGLPEHIHRDT